MPAAFRLAGAPHYTTTQAATGTIVMPALLTAAVAVFVLANRCRR